MQKLPFACALTLAMIATWLTAPSISAQDQAVIDWPTFQGNNARTGVSAYPPINQPEIAWSRQVGIMGYLNCPVIDGDRVFVTSSGDQHNKPDDKDGVYCLDLKTGEVLWHYTTNADACGIAIDRERVYVGDDDGSLQALDRETGERKWSCEMDGSVFAQPLLMPDVVVVGDQAGTLYACDRATGDIHWFSDGPSAIRGGLSSDGENIYGIHMTGELFRVSMTGRTQWKKHATESIRVATYAYPAPTLAGDAIYYGFARNSYYDVPALGCNTKDGDKRWLNKENDFTAKDGRHFGNIRSSVAIDGESLVYAEPYGNELVWVSQKTGQFEQSIKLGAPMFPHWPSPVIAKRQLYIPRHDGGLYAIDLEKRQQRWMIYLGANRQAGQTNLPENILPDDTFGTEWEPNVGKPIYATPALAKDGTLVIGTGEGWLYCIREKQ